MADRELKVLASRVKEAAKGCPVATATLRALFPEVFAPPEKTHTLNVGDLFIFNGGTIYRVESLQGPSHLNVTPVLDVKGKPYPDPPESHTWYVPSMVCIQRLVPEVVKG